MAESRRSVAPILKSAAGIALTNASPSPKYPDDAKHSGAKMVPDKIAEQAEGVRQAAARLTERIQDFQSYLGNLPGRVEAKYYGTHPDAEGPQELAFRYLVLKLHRDGKQWVLSCGEDDERNVMGDSVDYKLLTDAPLKFKIAAIKMFPSMLTAIEKSQAKLIEEINAATDEYDKFVKSLAPGALSKYDFSEDIRQLIGKEGK